MDPSTSAPAKIVGNSAIVTDANANANATVELPPQVAMVGTSVPAAPTVAPQQTAGVPSLMHLDFSNRETAAPSTSTASFQDMIGIIDNQGIQTTADKPPTPQQPAFHGAVTVDTPAAPVAVTATEQLPAGNIGNIVPAHSLEQVTLIPMAPPVTAAAADAQMTSVATTSAATGAVADPALPQLLSATAMEPVASKTTSRVAQANIVPMVTTSNNIVSAIGTDASSTTQTPTLPPTYSTVTVSAPDQAATATTVVNSTTAAINSADIAAVLPSTFLAKATPKLAPVVTNIAPATTHSLNSTAPAPATAASAPVTTTATTANSTGGKHALSGGSSKSEKASKKQRLEKKASKKAHKAAAAQAAEAAAAASAPGPGTPPEPFAGRMHRHLVEEQQLQEQQQQQQRIGQLGQMRHFEHTLQNRDQSEQHHRDQALALHQYQRQVEIAAAGAPILVQTPVLPGADQQRQLKVEDALAYLDRVKNQFGNQPEVYNQFLEIMKNFKSQTIDTPGVIERVSDLFRGHNNLILGFNTFLPPGFKIEIPSAQNNYGLPLLPTQQQHLMHGGPSSVSLTGLQEQQRQQQQQQHMINPRGHLDSMMGNGGGGAGSMGGAFRAGMAGMSSGGGGASSMSQGGSVSGAMSQSGAGNRQAGVSAGYSSSLRAHEGNSGMQMDATGVKQQHQQHAMMGNSHEEAMKQRHSMLLSNPVAVVMTEQGVGESGTGGQQQQQSLTGEGGQGVVVGAGGGPEDNGRQPIEFDHAINYVTKIKKRFSNDADTYKQFLDILHTYQKEQRSIKEVLDQVSELFKNHPDLLQQFTFFLPDAVREKASIEIQRITRQREQRERKARDKKAAKDKAKDKTRDKGVKDALSRMPQLERKLFQRIRAALSANDTWGEFLKCLDLFAQELLSRSELIGLLSDIFGSYRHELLEEFDRLLASRGATENLQEDAWFSMPLQDIDFAQCRRCTPSYRALPVTYPKPPCSERTALCRSVLNDSWVSMPTGSEDFSFMRKNQYEEALFKCEDDRYEIDLVIESNAATIRRLEPLVREIEALRFKTGDVSRFRYKLDRRTLSAIHLKAIVRVYGEHGTEILELLRKNPGGAIPVILKRLKQKDIEWRQSRKELNKGWKDTMAKSYYKALDHRGFYFKQTDKRACTSRQMLADIKEKAKARETVAAEAAEAAAAATGGGGGGENKQQQQQQQKQSQAEKEKKEVFGDINEADMTLEFDDVTVHQQAWALLQYTAEVQMSKEEAERANSLYRQFFHPLFRLPKSWKETLSSLSADELKSLQWDAQVTAGLVNAHDMNELPILKAADALPIGTRVVSEYGAGAIEAFDERRQVYQVQLGFGVAFLGPSMVVVDGNVPDEIDAATQPMMSLLNDDDASPTARSPVYYAPTHCYYFLQLYNMLFMRLRDLKHLCESGEVRTQGDSVPHAVDRALKESLGKVRGVGAEDGCSGGVVGTSPSDASQDRPQESIERFRAAMALVYGMVDGSIEGARFEDEMRGLLGAGAFFMFTVDKLVTLATKQLVALVSDDKVVDSVRAMDAYENNNNPSSLSHTGAGLAAVYKANHAVLMMQDGCCFRFQYVPGTLKPKADQQSAVARATSSVTSNDAGMMEVDSSSSGGSALARKPDAYSLPSEIQTEFTKPRTASDAWLQAPQLVVQMVNTVPCSTHVPPLSASSQVVPMVLTVKPLVVDFGASNASADTDMDTVLLSAGDVGDVDGATVALAADVVRGAAAVQQQQQPKKKQPFLMRTKSKEASSVNGDVIRQQQGLRMSLLLPLYRIAYVPGSEDVFRCITAFDPDSAAKSNAANNDRDKKYKKWFDAKAEELMEVSKVAEAVTSAAPVATVVGGGGGGAVISSGAEPASSAIDGALGSSAAVAVAVPAGAVPAPVASAADVEMGTGA